MTAELNSCDRDHVAAKPDIYYLALYRTSVPTSILTGESVSAWEHVGNLRVRMCHSDLYPKGHSTGSWGKKEEREGCRDGRMAKADTGIVASSQTPALALSRGTLGKGLSPSSSPQPRVCS